MIGLLFAGSEGTETEPATTIVNPINYAMNQLDIEMLTSGDHASAFVAKKTSKRASTKKRARAKKRSRAKSRSRAKG